MYIYIYKDVSYTIVLDAMRALRATKVCATKLCTTMRNNSVCSSAQPRSCAATKHLRNQECAQAGAAQPRYAI